MEKLTPISDIKRMNIKAFKAEKQNPKLNPQEKADSIEISYSKDINKEGYIKTAGILALTTAIFTTGIWGGKKVYNKYYPKLPCGIKKGEIDEAFYNFIKNNDPKCKIFNNKNVIIELNNKLSDEKLLILKQLAKMQSNITRGNNVNNRFSLVDIKNLLEETNQQNIKYIKLLAQKNKSNKEGSTDWFTTDEIVQVLKNINKENYKIADKLIEITEVSKEDLDKLIKSLKKINKNNHDIWQILLTTRKTGNKTELNIGQLQTLVQKIEETQNPKCAKVLLNAKKNNGTGNYIHEIDDIILYLEMLNENNADTYQKLYKIKSISEINPNKLKYILPNVNENNIDLVDLILSKKENNVNENVIFNNWERIELTLKSINKENKDISTKLLEIITNRDAFWIKNSTKENDLLVDDTLKWTDEVFLMLLKDFNNNPQNIEHANKILKETNPKNLNFNNFIKIYFNLN